MVATSLSAELHKFSDREKTIFGIQLVFIFFVTGTVLKSDCKNFGKTYLLHFVMAGSLNN